MDIFKRKKPELPPLISDAELDAMQGVDYNQVLEYLAGLSEEEYHKVCKVADIHRKAYQDSCDILGIPNEPSTFITPPAPAEPTDEPAFLDHQPKAKGKSKNAKA